MKGKILNEAVDIIRTRGVHKVSFRTLAQKCGIKSSSVHYHFPSKKELIHTILEEYKKGVDKALNDLSAKEPDPRKRLDAYVDMFFEWIREGGYEKGCTALMVGNELAESDEEVRSLVSGIVGLHTQWLAKTIREGQKAGIFKKEVDPESFGSFLLLMLEGGSTVSKATCSGDVLSKGGEYAKTLISSALMK